jgi:hypothetical protein
VRVEGPVSDWIEGKMVAERYKLMTPDAALLAFAEWNG